MSRACEYCDDTHDARIACPGYVHQQDCKMCRTLRQQLTEAQSNLEKTGRLLSQFQELAHSEKERAEKAEALYQDLIMQVACKFPNESRHETAKRYISEHENAEAVECKQALKEV